VAAVAGFDHFSVIIADTWASARVQAIERTTPPSTFGAAPFVAEASGLHA
jgi:hypothetical protein